MGHKILFIHHGGIAGGAPFSMLYTMQGLRERGYEPVCGLMHPLPALHELYADHGFATHELPYIPMFITMSGGEGKRYNPIVWRSLYRTYRRWYPAQEQLWAFVQQHGFAAVHLNSVGLSNPAQLLTEKQFPFVWHIREHGPVHRGRRFNFIQRSLRAAEQLIFLSRSEQRSWLGEATKGTIVHNFIDFKKFDADIDASALLSNLALPADQPCILYVGGSKRHKGIFPLLKSLALVKSKYGKAFKVLMPDTYLPQDSQLNAVQRRVRTLINRYDLKDNCVLMPFTRDIVPLYKVSDCLVFPATQPHFARPIIEASAMRKPVVATNLSAINELVIPGQTGYLVENGNVEELAERIVQLLRDPTLRQRLGQAGQQFARAEFEFDTQIDKIERIYQKLLPHAQS